MNMVDYYTLPNISGVGGLLQYANSVTSDLFTVVITATIMLSVFIILKTVGYRSSDSSLYASFIAFLLSSFLWAFGIIASKIIIIYLMFVIISALFSFLDEP